MFLSSDSVLSLLIPNCLISVFKSTHLQYFSVLCSINMSHAVLAVCVFIGILEVLPLTLMQVVSLSMFSEKNFHLCIYSTCSFRLGRDLINLTAVSVPSIALISL